MGALGTDNAWVWPITAGLRINVGNGANAARY